MTKEISEIDRLTITKLSVFDFDGTLIDTPLPDIGKITYKEKTGQDWPHEGWWSKPLSLDMTIFEMPVIKQTIESYNKEVNDRNTVTIMMTGRIKRLCHHVETILQAKGLTFHKYIYNMGGTTLDNKISSLEKLLEEYPNVTDILLTDDRLEHIPSFETWCKEKLDSGRITKYYIDVIPSGHH